MSRAIITMSGVFIAVADAEDDAIEKMEILMVDVANVHGNEHQPTLSFYWDDCFDRYAIPLAGGQKVHTAPDGRAIVQCSLSNVAGIFDGGSAERFDAEWDRDVEGSLFYLYGLKSSNLTRLTRPDDENPILPKGCNGRLRLPPGELKAQRFGTDDRGDVLQWEMGDKSETKPIADAIECDVPLQGNTLTLRMHGGDELTFSPGPHADGVIRIGISNMPEAVRSAGDTHFDFFLRSIDPSSRPQPKWPKPILEVTSPSSAVCPHGFLADASWPWLDF